MALYELVPGPFVTFVGDFQQLQPVLGIPLLKNALDHLVNRGSLRRVTLQQHAGARCSDPIMLEFLTHVRIHQPTRQMLDDVFASNRLESDLDVAVRQARAIKEDTGKNFTFLTVTNNAAASINYRRVAAEFPDALKRVATDGVRGDPSAGGGVMVFVQGMRIRLTRNLDEDRGFVNGTVGTIEHVLQKNVFVLQTTQNVRLIVHAIAINGETFMPCSFGYAMTVRRAQGSTLDLAGLLFDRPVYFTFFKNVAVPISVLHCHVMSKNNSITFETIRLEIMQQRLVTKDDIGVHHQHKSHVLCIIQVQITKKKHLQATPRSRLRVCRRLASKASSRSLVGWEDKANRLAASGWRS